MKVLAMKMDELAKLIENGTGRGSLKVFVSRSKPYHVEENHGWTRMRRGDDKALSYLRMKSLNGDQRSMEKTAFCPTVSVFIHVHPWFSSAWIRLRRVSPDIAPEESATSGKAEGM
jgi:hypothetical protein